MAVGATATSFLFMLLLFSHERHRGLTAQAYGAKNPQALARALVQPLFVALGAGALIVVLPGCDLALHIVGGGEQSNQGGVCWNALVGLADRWRIWYYSVGYSACNMPVRQ